MKVFITGATGFIGSNFVNHAFNNGIEIVAQKRPGSHPRIKIESNKKIHWIAKQLDQDFSKDDFEGCDVVVHFAAHSVSPPYASLSDCLYWNVWATAKFIENAIDSGIKRFIIAGSCFEYGLTANEYEFITPGAVLKPNNTYAISKALATKVCCSLGKEKELNMQILRIFQAYGDGEGENRFWPSLKRAALSGEDFQMSSGNQVRDFIHVSKVCELFLHALTDESVKKGQPVIRNIGGGTGKSLLEFANEWWSKYQAKGRLIPGSIAMRSGEMERIVANINEVHIVK